MKIQDDLSFELECGIDKKYFKKDMFLLMQSLITEANTIKMKYLKSLEGDNSLIGQEKSDILDEVEKFINTLFYAREYMIKSFTKNIEEYNDKKVTIELKPHQYRICGKLEQNDIERGEKVADFYEKYFIQSLSDAILNYKKAVEDKKITKSEAKDILLKLSYVFYEAILLKYILEYCIVNE